VNSNVGMFFLLEWLAHKARALLPAAEQIPPPERTARHDAILPGGSKIVSGFVSYGVGFGTGVCW
jgi:hypothetical protein